MFDSAAYLTQLLQLLPRGIAWTRDPDSMLGRVLGAFADALARGEARARQLLDEADPFTTLELLPDWERVAGLPDQCAPSGQTVPERQLAVARKIAGIGGQSIPFLIDIATRLSLEVEIVEFEPFTTDSTCDDQICDDAWRFAFVVRALPPSESSGDAVKLRFTALTCDGTVDERLDGFSADQLECVITRAAPAHTVPLFAYPADPEPAFWFDFTLETP